LTSEPGSPAAKKWFVDRQVGPLLAEISYL
jgi:hypothetical protein